MPMLPWLICPLAGQARLGQNVVAGSMRILLSWRCWGACQEGVCLDPHCCYKCVSPRLSVELPIALHDGFSVDIRGYNTTMRGVFGELHKRLLNLRWLVQEVKRSPNIGRPLFDSACVASSCKTSQCSARRPFSILTISATIQATGRPVPEKRPWTMT